MQEFSKESCLNINGTDDTYIRWDICEELSYYFTDRGNNIDSENPYSHVNTIAVNKLFDYIKAILQKNQLIKPVRNRVTYSISKGDVADLICAIAEELVRAIKFGRGISDIWFSAANSHLVECGEEPESIDDGLVILKANSLESPYRDALDFIAVNMSFNLTDELNFIRNWLKIYGSDSHLSAIEIDVIRPIEKLKILLYKYSERPVDITFSDLWRDDGERISGGLCNAVQVLNILSHKVHAKVSKSKEVLPVGLIGGSNGPKEKLRPGPRCKYSLDKYLRENLEKIFTCQIRSSKNVPTPVLGEFTQYGKNGPPLRIWSQRIHEEMLRDERLRGESILDPGSIEDVIYANWKRHNLRSFPEGLWTVQWRQKVK